jgi:hypothetical protein
LGGFCPVIEFTAGRGPHRGAESARQLSVDGFVSAKPSAHVAGDRILVRRRCAEPEFEYVFSTC